MPGVVLALTDPAAGPGRRLVSPMIGRDARAASPPGRLRPGGERLARASSSPCSALPGVGKSRLVHEFLARPRGPGARGARALPPVRRRHHVLARAGGRQGGGRGRTASTAMRSSPGSPRAAAEPRTTSPRPGALRDACQSGSRCVLVFDDIHWGEATFLDLVEHIADWTREAPILLICLARPELLEVRPSWGGGKLNATSVLLEPLLRVRVRPADREPRRSGRSSPTRSRRESRRPPRATRCSSRRCSRCSIDDGVLVRAEGRWAATRDLAAVPVPPTIQALLARPPRPARRPTSAP